MTLFEYLAIAFSLMLSSATMRLIGGLAYAMRPEARYWVHVGVVAGGLLSVVQTFWAFWSYRDVAWSMPLFLGIIAQLGTLYFLVTTLIPDDAVSVRSWRDHYYSIRPRFFGANIVIGLLVALNTTMLVDLPLDHPGRLNQIGIVGFGIVGVATANPRVHAALIGFGLVANLAIIATIMGRPGHLVP